MKRDSGVRQLGFQETDVVELLKGVTKYVVCIEDPKMIKFELQKAFYIANYGRKGPVVIDIPDDVQREEVEESDLLSYYNPFHYDPIDSIKKFDNSLHISECVELIKKAERPILVLGNGVKLSNSVEDAKSLAYILNFPIGLTWATMDMYPADHHLNIGGFGISSNRRGNFAIQNADLILSIGSRLDSHATGDPATFARDAKIIMVDIDPSELVKFEGSGMEVDIPIKADVSVFIDELIKALSDPLTANLGYPIREWHKRIKQWRVDFPTCTQEYRDQKDYVNPYVFLEKLSEYTKDDDIVFVDCGANLVQTFQGYKVKGRQKLLSALNNSPMGYSLAGSIGACYANGGKRIICIIGDGGFLLNIQELAAIKRNNLPIKIFLLNNHGYGIIKQTQDDWYDSRHEASTPESGLADPEYCEIVKAFGIEAGSAHSNVGLDTGIPWALQSDGPAFYELNVSPDQRIIPMLKYGRPIEDSEPLLNRELFNKQMIIKPMEISDGKRESL